MDETIPACVPRTQRSAPFFTAWCAAEPGPYRTPVLGKVPALRSGMKNAAPRPGHRRRVGKAGGRATRDRRRAHHSLTASEPRWWARRFAPLPTLRLFHPRQRHHQLAKAVAADFEISVLIE